MITRKLGRLLRGNATPFQLIAACVLGALLGFAPEPIRAPALYVLIVAALLVVNANLGLAMLVAGLSKLLSLVAAPLSFKVGEFLLDGPTSGLAHTVVNAPILAWCGLEYYAVAGGQLVALVVGTLLGVALSRSVVGFRRRMAAAQDNPTRLRELAAKPWARFGIWLLFGSAGKQSWEDKLAKRVGNPVRVWGAALLVLLLVGVWVGQRTLAGPLASRGLQAGLERVNGATVDVGGVELELGEGRVAVMQLALADPGQLDHDLLRADHLEADLDNVDFLRKRVHVRSLIVKEARGGAPREVPGERVGPPPAEPPEEAPGAGGPDLEDVSLEDVLAEYETWKQRLAQAQRWIDRLAGQGEAEGEDGAAGAPTETLSERLAREVAERGWFGVQASHLLDEAPTFRLSELVVDGLETDYLPGRMLDLRGSELSTHPGLVDGPPRLELASRDGALGFLVDLAPVSRGGGDGALRFHWNDLAVDAAMSQLKLPGGAPFRGGSLDLELDGTWDQGRIGYIDVPLVVRLRDTVLQLEGLDPTPIDELELRIGLKGPLSAPRISFDHKALTDALVAAGKQELANRARAALEENFGEELDQLQEQTGVDLDQVEAKLPDAQGALEGLFGRKKK